MIQLEGEPSIFFSYGLFLCCIFDIEALFILQCFILVFNMIVSWYIFFLFKFFCNFYEILLDLVFYLYIMAVFNILRRLFFLVLFSRKQIFIKIKESLLIYLSLIRKSNLYLLNLLCLERFDFLILNKRNILR